MSFICLYETAVLILAKKIIMAQKNGVWQDIAPTDDKSLLVSITRLTTSDRLAFSKVTFIFNDSCSGPVSSSTIGILSAGF